MTRTNILYLLGSVLFLVAAGGVVLYASQSDVPAPAPTIQGASSQAMRTQTPLIQPVTGQNPTEPSVPPQEAGVSPASTTDTVINTTNPSSDPAKTISPNSETTPSTTTPSPRLGQRGGMTIPAGSKSFFGSIASISGSTVTLTALRKDNATVTVTVSPGTDMNGDTSSKLVVGARVVGYGITNPDGSLSAQNIRINPTMPTGGKMAHSGGTKKITE